MESHRIPYKNSENREEEEGKEEDSSLQKVRREM